MNSHDRFGFKGACLMLKAVNLGTKVRLADSNKRKTTCEDCVDGYYSTINRASGICL